MKKIFVSIIALAALVGCNISSVEEVQTVLTAPLEIGIDDETRLFDKDLNWSWESDDEIAALQYAGNMTINTLSLKDNGKFGTDNFVYATNDPSMFVFVYPSEALNRDNYTLNFVQTGVWTPLLVGSVSNATVDAMPVISMAHQSAAFEIRVWDEGRAARKSIKSATITSTADFLNGGTTASVSGLDGDTVVFNIAQGNFDFELTLVSTDDETYTVAVPSRDFAYGKRTVLNVEWKYPFVEPKLSYNILSSYTNRDNSLDGRSIYVNDIVLTDADSATIALYLNGSKVADMTPGQTTTVSNLTPGEYKAQVKWSAKGRDYTSEETTVYVTGIPCEANFVDESYDGWSWSNTSYVSVDSSKSLTLTADTSWRNAEVRNTAIYSPVFYVVKAIEPVNVVTSIAATSCNVDYDFIGSKDYEWYRNAYIETGTKSSAVQRTSGVYITASYSTSYKGSASYVDNANIFGLTESKPCLVYSKYFSVHHQYINKIRIQYSGN